MAAMMTKRKLVFLTLSVVLMTSLLAGAMFGQATQSGNVYRYLSIFSEVFDLVRSNYVENPSSDALLEGAFDGITDAVDEFSFYVPSAQMAAFKNFQDVDDNGIGLVVTRRFGYAYVIAVVPGSPADKAGIERGEFIEKIDGRSIQKQSIWQIRAALQKAEPLKLQVLRSGQTRREEVTVKPAEFHPLALDAKTMSGIAYVKIPYFEKGTAAQFKAALEAARQQGQKKLIVDLRGNAGGSVEEAIDAADEVLTSGMITAVQGRRVESRQWQADRATAYDGELQVLTDSSTAAGAEVFAAAVRGNSRGKLVGTTTYGKAIVQRFIPLASGGGVQMTVAHYTTPDSKPILDPGVKPDVVVDLTAQALEEMENEDKGAPAKPAKDLILEKALELFGAELPAAEAKKAA
jgi:carboxyl-terminal processing protease